MSDPLYEQYGREWQIWYASTDEGYLFKIAFDLRPPNRNALLITESIGVYSSIEEGITQGQKTIDRIVKKQRTLIIRIARESRLRQELQDGD